MFLSWQRNPAVVIKDSGGMQHGTQRVWTDITEGRRAMYFQASAVLNPAMHAPF